MKNSHAYFPQVFLMTFFAGCTILSPKKDFTMNIYTKNLDTVTRLFPTSIHEIIQLKCNAIQQAEEDVKNILAIPKIQQTFENTFGAYDRAQGHFHVASSRISVLKYVSPNSEIRDASEKETLAMSEFSIDLFGYNTNLYNSLKTYAQNNAKKENLNSEQRYFIEQVLDGFKRAGLELSEEKRQEIKALQKELSALSIIFSKNIADDNSFIGVDKNELEGLDSDFITALQKTEEGLYRLGTDYPTYFQVMEFCSVASTRKKLFELFANRAYPKNKHVLEQIVAKRDQLAHVLGYASYAELNLDNEMVENPEKAKNFIDTLLPKAQEKEREEFSRYLKDLPKSVMLTPDQKIQPWDGAFIWAYYKKKYYDLDERLIAEYFPTESTVQGLLDIYESFFDLTMSYEPISGLWHEDVSLIKVHKKANNELLGYLFLDLYPRPNKYNHACEITIVPATKNSNNGSGNNPAVAVVLANFPKATSEKPSLLKRSDVSTFFHEFGHAIHTILGATNIISFSGTDVKHDFVEMPSQMLEYWLFDSDILKGVSKHYKTGEPLPDTIISTLIELKNSNAGGYVARQLFYAQLSLEIYGPGAHKDLDALLQKLWNSSLLFTRFDSNDHLYASFGHLTGYGARYYGYMWSKVFAADLFYSIKPHGLLNPKIGTQYAEKILAAGGSIDPNELLKNFLGRTPNEQAFLMDLGLKN